MKDYQRLMYMLMDNIPPQGPPGGAPPEPPEKPTEGLLGAFKAPAGTPPPETPPTPPPGTPPEPPAFTPNPMWDHLNTNYQIQAPDDLSAENEAQMLDAAYQQRAQSQVQMPELNPVVAELNQQFQNPEFKYDDWLNGQLAVKTLMNKTGKEFMTDFIKMEYGDEATDETITSIVEGMSESELALKVLDSKKVMKTREAELQQAKAVQSEQNRQTQITTETQRIDNELNNLFASTKNVREIYGVQVSEADVETFNRTFTELVKPDPTSGEIPIMRLLQSNEDIWRFAYMTLNGDQNLKKALFEAKEGTKASVFSKLKRAPTVGGQQAAPPVSNQLNPKRWTTPQQ